MERVTLVTGGSRGIGAATAKLCAEAGHAVAVNYLTNEKKAQAIAAEITAAGGNAITVRADTGVDSDVERMFKKISSELGTITGLVNNAGIHGPRGRLDELSDEDIRSIIKACPKIKIGINRIQSWLKTLRSN